MKALTAFLSGWLILVNGGCADFAAFRKKQVANRSDNLLEEHLEQTWRSGIGFDNPNHARRRAGLQPVSFTTGRTTEEENHHFFERLVGDAIGFVILSAGAMIGRAVAEDLVQPPPELKAEDIDPNLHRVADEEFQPPQPIQRP